MVNDERRMRIVSLAQDPLIPMGKLAGVIIAGMAEGDENEREFFNSLTIDQLKILRATTHVVRG